ncbi:hypothetical protein FHC49_17180 [Kluyvera sp. EC_51]|uniref:hypothetical protein n=1 Tax=Kluyvera sp. EC_51 TaxID=2584089 RepID=UPI001C7025B1|nr:hypothetical protein [Kluyvera sp. EC_51]MBW9463062.1 hypothetical protein [Kluyvera sp. EC_51]
MKKIIALSILISSVATAEPTIKSMTHTTYLCGDTGLVVKTAGLVAQIGGDEGYKLQSSQNEPATDEAPGFLSVQYVRPTPTSANADFFALTITKPNEFIALTYTNPTKKVEVIGMTCQIVE